MTSLIVLYTFDYINKDGLDMLTVSILTVKREFGTKAKIIIYTTNLDTNLQSLDVDIRLYNPTEFNHNPSCDFSGVFDPVLSTKKHFNSIGHARIYLIPYLLVTEKLPILYLDNDTGINAYKGTDFLHLISRCETPIGYFKEAFTSVTILEQKLKKSFTVDKVYCDINTFPINNGIQFIPYNNIGIQFTNSVRSLYEYLQKTCPTYFNDMFAFTWIWYATPGAGLFYNADTSQMLCYHYYIEKYENTDVMSYIRKYIHMGTPYVDLSDERGKLPFLRLFYRYDAKETVMNRCMIPL